METKARIEREHVWYDPMGRKHLTCHVTVFNDAALYQGPSFEVGDLAFGPPHGDHSFGEDAEYVIMDRARDALAELGWLTGPWDEPTIGRIDGNFWAITVVESLFDETGAHLAETVGKNPT